MTGRPCYDKRYFDKWYRHPKHRVSTQAPTARKAAMVVGIAEYYLERPVRSVLDVGCGEGQWKAILQRLRPCLRYQGIDASAYAIARYGRSRNLQLGTFGQLPDLKLAPSYDLIICSNMLYYVPAEELGRGLSALVAHLGGVAFLEAYASDDALEGDTKALQKRDAAFYRRLFRRHGLVPCGSHCYVGPELAGMVTTLERGG